MATNADDFNSLPFDSDTLNPTIVHLDSDYDDDSDGTVLGDEYEERFVRPTSQPGPHLDLEEIPSFSSNGRTLKPGKTVELQDEEFLRITAVIQHRHTKQVALEGLRFRRANRLGGLLEFKRNEVALILNFNEADTRDVLQQSIETIEITDVVRVRELIKTNRPFPALSFHQTDPRSLLQSEDYIMAHCRLVCRWKHALVSKNEGYIQALAEDEADEGCGVEAGQLRRDLRGNTFRGGACPEWLPGERDFDRAQWARCRNVDLFHFHRRLPSTQHDIVDLASEDVVDLTLEDSNHQPPKPQRRYTFGDAFCGAGGASRGAKGAGLRNDWSLDFDPAAIESYRRNFWQTRCEAMAAHVFATIIMDDYKVDILHMSPPCQPFSPLHTRVGKNDEFNEATFFAIEEILKKTKPRIVTLEETFGLTRTLDTMTWFRAMIQVFTKLGFSIRWKVFNLLDFGLPQPRKRLFVFASCPGEVLPAFPEATHCRAADQHLFPHLSRFTTVNDAISSIPRGFSLHNPDQVMKTNNEPPYNGNLPLRSTITCHAGHSYHPSGKRSFTLRELACLQGFPLEHEFGPTGTRMQIGNAVPPVVAKVFFEQIVRALRMADGI